MGKNGYFSDYLNAVDEVVRYFGRCLWPALSAHTPAGLSHRACIRYNR